MKENEWIDYSEFEEMDNFISNCKADDANPIPENVVDEILDFVGEVDGVELPRETVRLVGVLKSTDTYADPEYKRILDDFGVQYNEDEAAAFASNEGEDNE